MACVRPMPVMPTLIGGNTNARHHDREKAADMIKAEMRRVDLFADPSLRATGSAQTPPMTGSGSNPEQRKLDCFVVRSSQ